MKRLLVIAVVAVGLVTACSQGPDDPISKAAHKTASRSACVKAFKKYRDDIWEAQLYDGNLRKVITDFYVTAPLACPSHDVWDKVAKDVDPDSTTKWSSERERTAVWKGQCQKMDQLDLEAPAC